MDSPRLKQTAKTAKTPELPPRATIAKVPAQPETTLKAVTKEPIKSDGNGLAKLLEHYECGPIEAWARKASLNVAGSGKFSSDRTIAEYATGIWKVKPCPVS